MFYPHLLGPLVQNAHFTFLPKLAPQGATRSRALFIDTIGRTWIGKSPMAHDLHIENREVCKEKIANDIYAYLGVYTPKVQLSPQPYHLEYCTEGVKCLFFEEVSHRTQGLHLMVEFFPDFKTYPSPELWLTGNLSQQEYLTLTLEGRTLPEKGLGHVLAVARWIRDCDVLGATGKNIGYQIRESSPGFCYYKTCNIDPGGAFTFDDTLYSPHPRQIRIYTSGPHPHVSFDHLPKATREEFLLTLHDILSMSPEEIERFFTREGTDSLLDVFRARNFVDLLLKERERLAQEYKADLAAFEKEIVHKRPPPLPPFPHDALPLFRALQYRAWEKSQTFQAQQQRALYIPLHLTPEKPTPLEEKWKSFLAASQKVWLLIGESGAGKSTTLQILEENLWKSATPTSFIPLRIELKQFTSQTAPDCIRLTLKDDYQFTPEQILRLQQFPFLFFLDGVDEIQGGLVSSLTQQLITWPSAKAVITCRSTHLTLFPDTKAHLHYGVILEDRLAPFSPDQITAYLKQYHAFHNRPLSSIDLAQPLQELITTPFLLYIYCEALPLLKTQKLLTKGTLYQAFMEHWFQKQEARILTALGGIEITEDLKRSFLIFSKQLAFKLFEEGLNDTVDVSHPSLWSAFFSTQDPQVIQARAGCPLQWSREGRYSFLHKSFWEYFVAHTLLSLEAFKGPNVEQNLFKSFNTRLFTQEPAILDFLVDSWKSFSPPLQRECKALFFKWVKGKDPIAAANAITFLNWCGVSFSGMDLGGIAIPHATLNGAICHYTNFTGANLQGVKLQAQLVGANFTNAHLENVEFGELPMLQMEHPVKCIAYHPTQALVVVGLRNGDLELWNTKKTCRVHVFKGHTNEVTSVAFSPSGKCVVSGSWDGTVRLWNVETGASLLPPLQGHTDVVVTRVVFSPDGKRMASINDQTVRLWNVETGALLTPPLGGHKGLVRSVAFSFDGKYMASGGDDNTVCLWNAETGALLVPPLQGHSDWVQSVAFSPDGKCVASGSDDKTVRLWNVETGSLLVPPLQGHTWWVQSVAFSPDGKCVASGSDDKTVRLWSVETGDPLLPPLKKHTDAVRNVVFSPDGKKVASGSRDRMVCLWNAETGVLLMPPLQGHTGKITKVTFSPDSKYVASGSDDHTVRLWNAETGALFSPPFQEYAHWRKSVAFSPDGARSLKEPIEKVMSVAFSPDGKCVASGSSDCTVRVWNAETGALLMPPLKGHTNLVESVAFSSDGKCVASGSYDKTICLWNTEKGTLLLPPLQGHTGGVMSVAFSPNSKCVVSGSWDGMVRVWNAETGASLLPPLQGHRGGVMSVAFSPDGKWIVSGSEDCTVRLWNAETGDPLLQPLQGHTDVVRSVAFSSDGTYVASGSRDRTVRVWNAEIGAPLLPPLQGHTHWVTSVALSSDGKCVASGSWDRTVRFWNGETGTPLLPALKGHIHWVTSVAFSPDGKCVASGSGDRMRPLWYGESSVSVITLSHGDGGMWIGSGSEDHTVRLWNVETGDPLLPPLQGHTEGVMSVAFSPDGKRLASGSGDHKVCLWNTETRTLLLPPLQGHTEGVMSVAFSPDGKKVASGSEDRTVRFWNAETGAPLLPPLKGHTHLVTSVAFSPNGKRLASGSGDATVRLWNAETGVPLLPPLQGHTGRVNSVAFSPDGKYVVSGSDDKTVHLWNAVTGECLFILYGHHQPVSSVAWMQQDCIVTGGGDHSVILWKLKSISNETTQWCMEWRSPRINAMIAHQTLLEGAYLSPEKALLLQQRGAIGECAKVQEKRKHL